MKNKVKSKKSILEFDVSFGGANLQEKAVFAKHLSVMLKAGLTISEALGIAVESNQGKFKKILANVLQSVESGQTLSDSFKRYPKVFSGIFINATLAGEKSGTLNENLENIATQLSKEKELSTKIKGAMLYPVVVLVATFFLGLVMSFLVLPKIIPLFKGLKIDLPFTTRALIWFSNIIEEHGTILFVGIIFFTTLFIWTIKQKFSYPVTHWLNLRIPIVKRITKNVNSARFSRTLGTLLKSGLNIDEALLITRDTLGNYYYKKSLDEVSRRIGKGTKLSDSLNEFKELFPLMVIKMIKVGEESGKLEEVLFYLADYYDTEVDTATKSLSIAIEPVLLIFIGLVVGFLALSIITPIYEITGNVKR